LAVRGLAAMRVHVRLFAVLREHAGCDGIDLELDDGATVADALHSLQERASLAEPLGRLPVVMAVNRDYAVPTRTLTADDELALIPPVSGGTT
jgi:molybdopterin converting factor subunit 1